MSFIEKIMNLKQYVCLCFLPLMLSACALAGGSNKPEAIIYDLNTSKAASAIKGQLSRQIIIAEPKTLETLNSKSIIVKSSARGTISFLGLAEWIDVLPLVVQTQLLRGFENAGALGRVGVPGEQLRSDLLLVSDIRSFNVIDNGTQLIASVEISVKIINDNNGAVLAAKLFKAQKPVTIAKSDSMVASLNTAFQDVLLDIVKWTTAKF